MTQILQRLAFWLPGVDRELRKWFDDEAARNAARRHVSLAVLRSGRYWLIAGVALALALAGMAVEGPFFAALTRLVGALPLSWTVRRVITMGGCVVLALIAYVWLMRDVQRCILWKYLAARGIAVCLHCGYNLSGQVEPRCPECGRAAPLPAMPPHDPSAADGGAPGGVGPAGPKTEAPS